MKFVANDNGYADHKLAYIDENGEICTLKIPAVVSSGHGLASATGENIGGYTVVDDDGVESKYTCSAAADSPINLRHSNYPLTVENRVLCTHALAAAGLLGEDITLLVTLPLADYYLPGGAINNALVERVRQNFTANNVRPDGGHQKGMTAGVQEVRVSPEAVAAWFDWAMGSQGELNGNYHEMLDEQGVVLVVDVGGSTTDIVALTLSPDLTVVNGSSGTTKVGVLDVVSAMETSFLAMLRQEGVIDGGGHENLLTPRHREAMLSSDSIRFGSQRYDVVGLRRQAAAQVAARVENFIRNTAGNTLSYHNIIVVGGGAVVFKEALSELLGPGAVFLDEFANARGALKLMLAMSEQTEQGE